MKNQELFELAEKTFAECLNILKNKNHDYATGKNVEDDALKNFKLVEYLNITDVTTGILVRMCDKISRLSNVYKGTCKVKNESCLDTAKDLINYTVILLASMREKINNNISNKED
jgi:hypothetical protein